MKRFRKAVVVVTGGAGYIGSHVVAELIKAGEEIVVLDDLSAGSEENLFLGPEFIKGDFASPAIWKTILKYNKVKAVIHLAAKIDANESLLKPGLYYEHNTFKTIKLLEILKGERISKLVFASTAAVYGRQIILPISENAQLRPINPYGSSKLLAEQVIEYYCQYLGLNAVILRFFNAVGTTQEVMVHPQNPHGLLAQIKKAIQQNSIFKIFGDEYETKDGTCIRDLVHTVDLARAHVASLNYLKEFKGLATFNVGSGTGFTIKEILTVAQEVSQQNIEIKVAKPRAGEIPVSVADISVIGRVLKFELKYSDLKTILNSILL
ncbi:MAG: UDP-glucose 4-epimerase GalE [Candidatus Doudnabacteria bacterium]